MVRNKNIFGPLITGVLLVLYVATTANATMFWHGHRIGDATIAHSHFHGTAHHSTPDGGHSTTELLTIALIDRLTQEQSYNEAETGIVLPIHEIILSQECPEGPSSQQTRVCSSRAPPVM